MKFQESFEIESTSELNETPYVPLRDRPVESFIGHLDKQGFGFDPDRSLIGYNSRGIPTGLLNIPLRLWRNISSDKIIILTDVHLVGANSLLKKEHTFELILKEGKGSNRKNHLLDEINVGARLITDHIDDYFQAINVMRDIEKSVRSVYRK